MVTSKNPFSPMLMEDHTPTRAAPPPINESLNFPVSLDSGPKKTLNGELPVLRQKLQKRETGVDFVRDGRVSGEFSFTGSPIQEIEISGLKDGYNNHKLRRRNRNDDVVAAATQEEAFNHKKLQIKTNQSCYAKFDDISPTDVMNFPSMTSPRSPTSNVPPTPTKPRQYRRPQVKRYTPVRKPMVPNTPMLERKARARSFDLDEDENDSKMAASSSGNRQVQSRFHSDFDVIGELGTGSFGNVLKVLSRLDGCMYAIKVAHRPAKGNADKDRMLKEVSFSI
jgi:hypothetical protein